MMSAESHSEKSLSYQKKDGCRHARPSFFWYDNYKRPQGLFSRDTRQVVFSKDVFLQIVF